MNANLILNPQDIASLQRVKQKCALALQEYADGMKASRQISNELVADFTRDYEPAIQQLSRVMSAADRILEAEDVGEQLTCLLEMHHEVRLLEDMEAGDTAQQRVDMALAAISAPRGTWAAQSRARRSRHE